MPSFTSPPAFLLDRVGFCLKLTVRKQMLGTFIDPFWQKYFTRAPFS